MGGSQDPWQAPTGDPWSWGKGRSEDGSNGGDSGGGQGWSGGKGGGSRGWDESWPWHTGKGWDNWASGQGWQTGVADWDAGAGRWRMAGWEEDGKGFGVRAGGNEKGQELMGLLTEGTHDASSATAHGGESHVEPRMIPFHECFMV